MILQQFYRYVFCAWDTLLPEEQYEAPPRLKPWIDKTSFRAAIQKNPGVKVKSLSCRPHYFARATDSKTYYKR